MRGAEGFTMRNFIVCTIHLITRVIKSRRLRWAGHVDRMEEGRRPLGRPRRRRDDNIRMDLKEIGINIRNWVDLAQDRDYWRALVNAALNLRVP